MVGVNLGHPIPSPCSSPYGRGDLGLTAIVFASFRGVYSKLCKKMVNIMVFAEPSPLLWGEEQGEGVSCLRGGSHG